MRLINIGRPFSDGPMSHAARAVQVYSVGEKEKWTTQ